MKIKIKFIIKQFWFWLVFTLSSFTIAFALFFNSLTSLFATSENLSITKSSAQNYFERILNYDISEFYYFAQEGKSSWYGKKFHLRRTSSGEPFDMYSLTVAHRFLPFGTIVRIINLENGKNILARVTDRGPFVKNRIVDLSFRVAKEIGGLANPKVKIEALVYDENKFDPTEKYLFGYSFDFPLICLPESKVQIFARFTDFDEAFAFYSKFVENYPGIFSYIFVPANPITDFSESQDEYLIGVCQVEESASLEYLVKRVE